jgi:hypothetical protein
VSLKAGEIRKKQWGTSVLHQKLEKMPKTLWTNMQKDGKINLER